MFNFTLTLFAINLQQLLRTGICIDLCEGKQLRLGRAAPAIEGKTIADILLLDPCSRVRCLQVTALFRNSTTHCCPMKACRYGQRTCCCSSAVVKPGKTGAVFRFWFVKPHPLDKET